MKIRIILSFLFLLNLQLFAQDTETKIILVNIHIIDSKILNETRKVWVYVPNGADPSLYSQLRYPVVYVLDGDAHFYSVVGMIQQLSQVNGNTICPEMIVVGIPNTNRTRDLTPKTAVNDPKLKAIQASAETSSGGNELFLSFVENELMPYINENYPTSTFNALIGHSFGGLTVMNALTNHTKMFNSYICIDPSMWWDNGKFLKETEKKLSTLDFSGKTLYLGIANTMEEGMNIKKVVKDTTQDTEHIRSILEMDKYIKSEKPKGLRYASKYYENDSHGSVPLITEYDALHFIFESLRLKVSNKDFEASSPTAFINKIDNHYKEASKLMGYTIKPSESQINNFGYVFLEMKKYEQSDFLFSMNIKNYPNSFNVYDSYGDYYLAIGDKTKAIENFKKALSLKENPDSRRKYEELIKESENK